MVRNKYETVRISPEAKQKLQLLCKKHNITMVKGLNRLLNISDDHSNLAFEIYRLIRNSTNPERIERKR